MVVSCSRLSFLNQTSKSEKKQCVKLPCKSYTDFNVSRDKCQRHTPIHPPLLLWPPPPLFWRALNDVSCAGKNLSVCWWKIPEIPHINQMCCAVKAWQEMNTGSRSSRWQEQISTLASSLGRILTGHISCGFIPEPSPLIPY